MFSHTTQIRVRYGETDQMGLVYYGNYCLYYEAARAEAIRSVGLTYRQLEESGVLMPVVRVDSKYVHGAQYDDLMSITTVIPEMPDRFIVFKVEIQVNEQLIHKATVTLCFREKLSGKRIRAPRMLTETLEPYF